LISSKPQLFTSVWTNFSVLTTGMAGHVTTSWTNHYPKALFWCGGRSDNESLLSPPGSAHSSEPSHSPKLLLHVLTCAHTSCQQAGRVGGSGGQTGNRSDSLIPICLLRTASGAGESSSRCRGCQLWGHPLRIS
jgi:hypothetical protein